MHATNENEILASVDGFISQLPVQNARGNNLKTSAHSSEQAPESLTHANHGKTNANPAVWEGAPNPCAPMQFQRKGQYLQRVSGVQQWWFSRAGGAFQPPA